MKKVLSSESEMIEFGVELAGILREKNCHVVELVGDVGAGKTTLTKGLAKALGAPDGITSPSFTISKQYETDSGHLVHYDFYRLSDPGIMVEDLAENLADENTIVVIEWGESVADLLPENRLKIDVKINDDNTRTIEFSEPKSSAFSEPKSPESSATSNATKTKEAI